MRIASFIAVVVLVGLGTSARAAKLVVMGVNLRGPAPLGQKVYTIGVDMEGQSGFLAVQLEDLFIGTGLGGSPKQGNFDGGGDAVNRQTLQSIEDSGANAATSQYDTWWYSSSDGLYTDVDTLTTITTDPIVGVQGDLWRPAGLGITGGTGPAPQLGSGTTIGFTGLFGPFPNFSVDAAETPVIPLVQVRVAGSLSLQYLSQGGSSLDFIDLIDPNANFQYQFNVLGGAKDTDPHAILDFNTDTIHALPEPQSIALAMAALTMGALARFVAPMRGSGSRSCTKT